MCEIESRTQVHLTVTCESALVVEKVMTALGVELVSLGLTETTMTVTREFEVRP